MAYRIVVGYDGSEHSRKALDAAIEIAKMASEGDIFITCAQHRSAPAVGFRGAEFGVEEMWDEQAEKIEKELAEAAERVRGAGVPCATACTPDRPDVTMLTVAHEIDARMIVVGARGAGAREGQRSILGSTTTRLLHEAADVPVLVV